jgi:antitoxin component of MazEF toxin-antitoxin module
MGMIECEVKPMKIGNSIGFTIPKGVAKEAGIKPGKPTTVLLSICEKDNLFEKYFGSLKTNKSAEELNAMTNDGEDMG